MLDGLRILLVEDDEIDRQSVHRAVKRAGLDLTILDAVDLAEAKELLERDVVDCVVTDYNLPDGTALDLLAFNEARGDARLPMVVLTGHDDDGLAIEALQEGAEDYIAKGRFEAFGFARSVRYAMERASLRRKLSATNARLIRELEVGGSIQTSILPKVLTAKGLEVVADMTPATEVGGDLYDLLPTHDGAWIAIGDVAGHGMAAAIVALMTQSVISGVSRSLPDAPPSHVVSILNEVLHDNIRHRLKQDEHVTFTLLRYFDNGRVQFAGAHEEIAVLRKDTQEVELVMTPGTWLGARRDVSEVTHDQELTLAVGDVMILYTDGVTEAFSADGEMFELERMVQIVKDHASASCEEIHRAIWTAVDEWTHEQDDDVTLMVIRRTS